MNRNKNFKNSELQLLSEVTGSPHLQRDKAVLHASTILLNAKVAVIATCDSVLKTAHMLATHLHLPLVTQNQSTEPCAFLLAITPARLELRENSLKSAKPIFVDFLTPQINYRTKYGGGKNQLIAKAIGVKNKKNLVVVDATAGFGVDAFILASLGCVVTMLERSPIISALLVDGLERLWNSCNEQNLSPLHQNLRITLESAQSLDYINKIIQDGSEKPDVIYLDPMYPKRSKSALNKKTMRILHEIVGDDCDASKLFEAALQCVKNRVVVKRPKLADYLGELKPNLQFFSSGSSRYDVYFPSL